MAAAQALLEQGGGAARWLRAELMAHYLARRILCRFTCEDYERLSSGWASGRPGSWGGSWGIPSGRGRGGCSSRRPAW